MKRLISVVTMVTSIAAGALGADLYFDNNGTTAGFGTDSGSSPFTADFTAATWNTDATGGSGGALTTVSTGDILHITPESGSCVFNFANYSGVSIGGLHTYSSGGSIGRLQKPGGGLEWLDFQTGAEFKTDTSSPIHWHLRLRGDFTKTGSSWTKFADNANPKLDGTMTISNGYLVVVSANHLSSSSDLVFTGNFQLRFQDSIDDGGPTTVNVGTLSGSTVVVRDGSGSNLANLTVSSEGCLLGGNDTAGEQSKFGWGSTVALTATATTTLDINKSSGITTADVVSTDSGRDITLGGTLTVTLASGSEALKFGDSFDLISGNPAGSFATVNLPTLSADLAWDTSSLSTDGTITIVRSSVAQDMYLDLNGTTAGFGIDSTESPVSVNPAVATWNSDATGGAGGYITSLVSGDTAHFELSGTGGVVFNWTNYAGTALGGIVTAVESGTPSITRMQKHGADGGLETLTWSAGAVFDTGLDTPVHWNFITSGDFSKTGSGLLSFPDNNNPKIDGTVTISQGSVAIAKPNQLSSDSHFAFTGNFQLLFQDNIDDGGPTTVNVGTLSGSTIIVRNGSGSDLGNLTVSSEGCLLGGNDTAGEQSQFGWGATVALTATATTTVDIIKSSGVTSADKVWTDSGRDITLGGVLTVTLAAGSEALAPGDSFDLFSDDLAGSFATVNLPALNSGMAWDTSLLTTDGTISITRSAPAQNMYMDMNGTNAGFGLASGDFYTSPTAATWNSDATGGDGGFISTLIAGDSTHFMLSGSSAVTFNWTNYSGTVLGGITVGIESGSPWIGRMQKHGADGGEEDITWSAGAVVDTPVPNGFWWNLGTTGDFTKTGSSWLRFGDGTTKVDGTCTIDDGYIVLRRINTVNASSSFKFTGSDQLRILNSESGVATVGNLIGEGSIIVDGAGDIQGVTISSTGVVLTNNIAGEAFTVGYGGALTLAGSAVTEMDITKSGGTPSADSIVVDWGSETLTLGGTLNVTLVSGSETLGFGDTFDLLSDTLAGAFATVNLPTLSADLAWDTSSLGTDGTIAIVRSAVAQDMYLDLNGTTAGFGIDSTESPVSVNPAVATWNTDATGGAGGYITSLVSGDTAHFELSGTGGVVFNWTNYAGTALGGIVTAVESGTPSITRMQKHGADGGLETLTWSAGAVFDTGLDTPVHWNFTTSGDFSKTGSGLLSFPDNNNPKIDGTVTISQGSVAIAKPNQLSSDSHFEFTGNFQLLFQDNIDDGGPTTVNVGTLSGSTIVVRNGSGSNLANLTVNSEGCLLGGNDTTGEQSKFGWGSTVALTATATTTLDINKSSGLTSADKVLTDSARDVTLGGVLTVTLATGSEALTAGDTFDLFSDNLAGSFSSVNLPTLSGDLWWNTDDLTIDGTIAVSAPSGTVFRFK